jgi:hypothetical protein
VSKNAEVLATCLCPEGVEQWCYVNNTRAVGWARRSALTPYLIMGAAEAYCHQCDVRLNADGTTTPMVPAATAADITRERDEAQRVVLDILDLLRDRAHEVAAEDCPYVVERPDQSILAGLRDGWFQGRNRALSVMQGSIAGIRSVAEAAYTSTGGTVPEQPAQSEPAQPSEPAQ